MKRHIGIFMNFVRKQKLFICLILAIILACVIRLTVNKQDRISVSASSLLTGAADIAELSTAEFMYRGIAEIYNDEAQTRLHCRVCYNAVVKAGIDLNDVKVSDDPSQKTITVALPEISLNVTVIDEQKMAILPSNVDVSIDKLLKYSREDAENEARQSTELMNIARENLQAAIGGILYPLIKQTGYTIIWK